MDSVVIPMVDREIEEPVIVIVFLGGVTARWAEEASSVNETGRKPGQSNHITRTS